MAQNKENLIITFKACWDNCYLNDKIRLFNTWTVEENYGDEEIYNNDEDFFDAFFHNNPTEAVRAAYYGSYNFGDDYVWINAYGNLSSSSYEAGMPFEGCEDDLAEYFIECYSEIEDISEMENFYDAVVNYNDNDEEEND